MSKLINAAMLAIQSDVHAVGIGKTRTNTEQRFNFRGIDDALMAFSPLLSAHKVLLKPRYHDLVETARATKSGGTTYNVKLQGTFTFVHAEDDTEYTVGPFYGEANDGQDKAVSKAESVALRQMFFITFTVPHEPVIGGDPDSVEDDEEPPQYSDWREAMNERDTVETLREVKAEMLQKFNQSPPAALVAHYNARLAAIRAAK
jgi:hypothetical protein